VWDGYPAARQRLYSRIKETKAQNPIVISGDVHVHYGADLRMDFTDPKSEIVASEFTNTSISAGGDGADVAGNWEGVRAANPHIRYHSARRGYIACTATPAAMRADFRILDRVTVADAPMKTGGSLVVEAGRRGANPA
jgi:alkaline phosphatase D